MSGPGPVGGQRPRTEGPRRRRGGAEKGRALRRRGVCRGPARAGEGWSGRRDPGWTARASRLARRVVSHGGPPAGGGASPDGGGGVPVGWSDLAGGGAGGGAGGAGGGRPLGGKRRCGARAASWRSRGVRQLARQAGVGGSGMGSGMGSGDVGCGRCPPVGVPGGSRGVRHGVGHGAGGSGGGSGMGSGYRSQ